MSWERNSDREENTDTQFLREGTHERPRFTGTTVTRDEHMQWCKQRALEILDNGGDVAEALASMGSDLNQHPETEGHIAMRLGMGLMMIGSLNTAGEMRKFIEGFN